MPALYEQMRGSGQLREISAENLNVKFRTKLLSFRFRLLVALGFAVLALFYDQDLSVSDTDVLWAIAGVCFWFLNAEVYDRFLHYIKIEDESLFVHEGRDMFHVPYAAVIAVDEIGDAVRIKYWQLERGESVAKQRLWERTPERRAQFLAMLRERLADAA